MRDSILGLQGHDLSRRQLLNQLSQPGSQMSKFYRALGVPRPRSKNAPRLIH